MISKNKVWSYGILPIGIVILMILLFGVIIHEASPYVESKVVMNLEYGRPFYGEELLEPVMIHTSETIANEDETLVPVNGERYGYLKSESIDLSAPLYYGDSDEILQKGVGQFPNGALIGEKRSVLIGGHDSSYFATLEQAEVGTRIEVVMNKAKYTYEVVEIQIMNMKELAELDWDEKKEQIILYTCYPFGKVDEERGQRILYYCRPVEE